jgi:hypothetical protein
MTAILQTVNFHPATRIDEIDRRGEQNARPFPEGQACWELPNAAFGVDAVGSRRTLGGGLGGFSHPNR